MKLSVVTTLYRSERYIEEFYKRVTEVVKAEVDSYEIIFVDDGSPDHSLRRVIELSSVDPSVKVVELAKNHGHHRAMMIGLEHAEGEHVFLIDCDLEEVPENFRQLWAKYSSSDEVDVVYGVQERKSGGFVKKALSLLFYTLFNFFSGAPIPNNELVSRIMCRRYVKALLSYPESELFIPGVWVDAGFRRVAVPAKKVFDGESSYSLARRVNMAVDAITSFSTKPLVYIFYLGMISSSVSVLYLLYLVLGYWLYGVGVDGWTSIIASIYLVGSFMIFSIGVVGIYLSRIFSEVKRRPNAIVRNVYVSGGVCGE